MVFFWQEYWSGLPCPPPGYCPNPGLKPRKTGTFFIVDVKDAAHASAASGATKRLPRELHPASTPSSFENCELLFFILVYFDFPYRPIMRANQCEHIHIFPTFMSSVFCFYFPSTSYSLSLEDTFPVTPVTFHTLQISPVSPMPLNRYYFSSLAFPPCIHPQPSLRCGPATWLFLHPLLPCSHVFGVQPPEPSTLAVSSVCINLAFASTVHTISLLKVSTCDVLALS